MMLDEFHHIGYLVDGAAVVIGPRTPLVSIHGPEVAVLIGPLVPDGHLIIVEVLDVGVAAQEPEQFVNDAAQVQFLGGEQREAVGHVEPHLVAEDALRASARAVGLHGTLVEDALQQV